MFVLMNFCYKIHIKRKKNTSLPNDSSFTAHHDSQGISNHFERSVFIYFTKQHKYKFSHTMFCLICPNSYYLISMENSISHEIYWRNMLKCLSHHFLDHLGEYNEALECSVGCMFQVPKLLIA